MRKIAGWALVVLGVLIALLGVVLAAALGPDNRRTTGPHKIETNSSVIVTAPRVVRWANVQVDVLAEVPAKKPVFVGVGNTVDVRALVGDVDRVEVAEFSTPWKPKFVERDGELPSVQGAPTAMDWWLDSSAGLGGASISSSLPAEPVSIAVMSIGSSKLSGLEVTFAYGIKGGFLKGIGLALAGLGLSGLGAGLVRGSRDAEVTGEQVSYIYVDGDGVEHELTAAEVAAEGYVIDDPEPASTGANEPGPVAESTESGSTESRPVEGEPTGPKYVWIDDNGVEHEVTEAELAAMEDYVLIDEREKPDNSRPADDRQPRAERGPA